MSEPEKSMPADQHQVFVFDTNETLSDLTSLRSRFEDIGVPGQLLLAWFADCETDSR